MERKRILVVCLALILVSVFTGTVWAKEKININSASVKELTQLKKIGPALAKRIVKHREEIGPFKKPEDIIKVSGIGPKVFEMNKERIIVKMPKGK